MIGNSEFFFLVILGLCVLFFTRSLKAKEIAVSAAMTQCGKSGVQFLDGTAVLKNLRLIRTTGGSFRLYRRYEFDYSEDGNNRKRGEVIMLSQHVERTSLWLTLNP